MKRIGPESARSIDLWSATSPGRLPSDSHAGPAHATSRRLRIALIHDQVYPYFKGGVEKRMWDFGRELADRGHDVHTIGAKKWDGPDTVMHEGVACHGIRTNASPHTRSGRRSIWQAVSYAFGLSRRMLRERFDIIDVQSTAPLACLAILLIGRLKGACVVVTWHEVWREYWREYLGPAGRLGQAAEWLLARLGRFHLANSAFTASKLKELGIEADAVIPCGVDVERIDAARPAERHHDIISVSRLVPHKNQELLIDAVEVLASYGVHPSTLIVGSGPELSSIEQRVRAKGLDNVELMTNVDSEGELYGLLKSSRVFALPSVREGFGLAIIEAAASGVPAVVVDHPDNGASELVHPDLVVQPSPVPFAESLQSLLADDALLAKMAKHAADVVEGYELAPIVDRLEALYFSARARV